MGNPRYDLLGENQITEEQQKFVNSIQHSHPQMEKCVVTSMFFLSNRIENLIEKIEEVSDKSIQSN